jgi:WD40 repeat protein
VCLPGNEVRIASFGSAIRLVHRYPQPAAESFAFSPDGRLLATGCKNCTVIVTDLEAGPGQVFIHRYDCSMSSLAISPAGGILAMGFIDGLIHVRGLKPPFEETREVRPLAGLWDPAERVRILDLTFSPDGRFLAGMASAERESRIDDRSVRVVGKRKAVFLLSVAEGYAASRRVPVDSASSEPEFPLRDTEHPLFAFSRDSGILAVGDEAGKIHLFRLPG